MKIIHIRDHNPFFQSTATANRFIGLIEGLKNNGISTDILYVNGYLNTRKDISLNSEGIYKGFQYKYIFPDLMRNRYYRKIFKIVWPFNDFINKIEKEIVIGEYDIVWLDLSSNLVKIGVSLFKKNLNVRYFHERSEYSWIGIKNENIHKLYLDTFLRNVDSMSIMTKTLLNYYKRFLKSDVKTIHIPMTVDFSRFNINKSETELKQPYIAYCGKMRCQKDGVDILVEAFIKIMDVNPNYHLYLAGSLEPQKDYNLIKNIILKHNAESRITFIGLTPKEKIPLFLKNASICALARPESKQAEGGFPTKLGEYLASGNPVCVTDVGEISDYLKDGESAFIARPDSIESFADKLQEAISSDKSKTIGLEGKRIAYEQFNKDKQARKLAEFFKRI